MTSPILGITAEYDPFHNGHAHHLASAKELSGAETCVCVMSGDFTQRGEPALADKWERAKIAVQQGLSLVFELPFYAACSRAERFASAAVDILASVGVTHIAYGCEAKDPRMLEVLAQQRMHHASLFEAGRRSYMQEGLSYAKAGELASRDLFGDELTDLSLSPNNILALEYLRRISFWKEQGREILPVPVIRAGSAYKEIRPDLGFAGGSALRLMAAEGKDIRQYIPYAPITWADLPAARRQLYLILRGIILRSSPQELAGICSVGEGMENRLKEAALSAESYKEFLSFMTSKRYTASVIRRIMVYILLGYRGLSQLRGDGAASGTGPVYSRVLAADASGNDPAYARVLAADASGRALLRKLSDEAGETLPEQGIGAFPIIASNQKREELPQRIRTSLLLDEAASNLYHLITGAPVDLNADGRKHPYIHG